MARSPRLFLLLTSAIVGLASVGSATAIGNADVAALQATLHLRGFYSGDVDGLEGNQTRLALRRLQLSAGLEPTGSLNSETRAALGPYAKTPLGSRLISRGLSGWDVAALQYLLAWHGFPSGTMDGRFSARTEAALMRFQRWARLPVTGVVDSRTVAALRLPPARSPLVLDWPLRTEVGDGFGSRHMRFHTGLDLPAVEGSPVRAAGSGRVIQAGWLAGGWGYSVTVAHPRGLQTMYAHLSSVGVRPGAGVRRGEVVGRVGASGDATGAHLHFEVRLRGAAIDPRTALR